MTWTRKIRITGDDTSRIGAIAMGVLLTGLLVGCTGMGTGTSNQYSPADNAYEQAVVPEPVTPKFDQPPQTMPNNGEAVWLGSKANNEILQNNIDNGGYGRLSIAVPSGQETYFVKLRQIFPGRGDTLGVTVAPGQTITIDVPLSGNGDTIYDLYYGAGTSWYGYKYLFGPEASYTKADDEFSFTESTSWEVELIRQPAGNLGTYEIDYADF